MGIEAVKSKDESWYINHIQEDMWGAYQQLDNSTEILQVDGLNLSDITESNFTITHANTLKVIHEGDVKNLEISYKGIETQFIKHIFVPLLYLILTMFLSFYLYHHSSKKSKKFLILHLQYTALAYTSAGAAGRGDYLSNIVVSLTIFMSIVCLILYCNYFLKTMNENIQKKLKIFIIVIAILLLTMNIVRFFVNGLLSIQITFELIIFISLFFLFFINMIVALKNNVYYARPLLFIFFLGTGPFFLFYGLPVLLQKNIMLSADTTAIFLLIVPICLIYLELSERLVNLQYALDRMFAHLKIAIPFSLILASILILLTKNISLTLLSLYFLVIFIGLIIVLYLKESIEVKSDRYIVTSEYYTQSNFYDFIKTSSKVSNVDNVIEYIKNEISLILKVSLKYIEIIKEKSLISSDYTQMDNFKEISKNLIYKSKSEYVIVLHENIEEKWIALVQITGNRFPLESLKVLELFLYYIHNMIDNLLKVEELVHQFERVDNMHSHRWYSKIWIHSSEKERKRLSAEIHDTVLQDLIQINRQLEDVVVKPQDNENLMLVREEVLDIIENTRDICENLYPPMIERFGLNRSLEELLKKNKLRFNTLIKEDFEQINQISIHQATSIYRIIQELLSNANKHSKAEIIEIKLKLKDSKIYIEYFDDGIGFNPKLKLNEVKALGLLGIRERIKYYEGELDIRGNKLRGVQIRIIMKVGDDFENNDIR